MLLIMRSSSSLQRGVACIAGITLGIAVHVVLSLAGVAVLLLRSQELFGTVKLAGALYLIYIGVKVLLAARRGEAVIRLSNAAEKGGVGASFIDGLLCNLLNPKVTVFILSIFTQVIPPTGPLMDKVLAGGVLLIEVFLVWSLFLLLVRWNPVHRGLLQHSTSISYATGSGLVGFGVLLAAKE